MSQSVKSLLLPASLLAAAEGHICMWSPVQRGGAFEIVTPGQSICYLKDPPCGGTSAGEPLTSLTGGNQFDLHFQQNLNHFYQPSPGQIVADFAMVANPTEEDFIPLEGTSTIADWNGMNMITQTNFSMSVTIPNIDCEACVLRTRYVSTNPTEDHGGSSTFHQCADVTVKKSDAAKPTPTSGKKSVAQGNDCCSPKQFSMEGYETSDWRNPTHFRYFFDAENEVFRVDQDSGSGVTAKDGKFKMFNEFQTGLEYYYNENADTCLIYHLNLWQDWCYGSTNNQVWRSEVRVGDEMADVWGMEGNEFFFTNAQGSCTPISKARGNGELTMYYNFVEGPPVDGFFDLPVACEEAKAKYLETKEPLEKSPRANFYF